MKAVTSSTYRLDFVAALDGAGTAAGAGLAHLEGGGDRKERESEGGVGGGTGEHPECRRAGEYS